jgi:hypothetical protein
MDQQGSRDKVGGPVDKRLTRLNFRFAVAL